MTPQFDDLLPDALRAAASVGWQDESTAHPIMGANERVAPSARRAGGTPRA